MSIKRCTTCGRFSPHYHPQNSCRVCNSWIDTSYKSPAKIKYSSTIVEVKDCWIKDWHILSFVYDSKEYEIPIENNWANFISIEFNGIISTYEISEQLWNKKDKI